LTGGLGDEISVRVRLHKTKFWLLVPIELYRYRGLLRLVLDTGTPQTGISASLLSELQARGLAPPSGIRFGSQLFLLERISIEGQPISDFEVQISPSATRLGIDGILGLDFLAQFRRVCFDVDDMRLTLTPRP
jgi:hypothetical protein